MAPVRNEFRKEHALGHGPDQRLSPGTRQRPQLYTTINTIDPHEKVRMLPPRLWHSRVVSNTNLTVGGSLAGTTPVLPFEVLFTCAGPQGTREDLVAH